MNKTPLDKKIKYLGTGNSPDDEILKVKDVQEAVKDLKNEIRKLGVKIDKNDKFDFIGVNNAIFSINKHFGTLAQEDLKDEN